LEGLSGFSALLFLDLDQFIGEVILVDVGDVVDGLSADTGSCNRFDIVDPKVGVKGYCDGDPVSLLRWKADGVPWCGVPPSVLGEDVS
jgi:hypothetical protein